MEIRIEALSSITTQKASEIAFLSRQLGYEISVEETFGQLEKIILNNDNCIFIALQNEKIVGWIHGFFTLRVESKPFVEIAGLVVHEACRNQQVGKGLIYAVSQWSKRFNVRKIKVRCNEIRSESHQFYRHLGFEQSKKQLIFEIDVK